MIEKLEQAHKVSKKEARSVGSKVDFLQIILFQTIDNHNTDSINTTSVWQQISVNMDTTLKGHNKVSVSSGYPVSSGLSE